MYIKRQSGSREGWTLVEAIVAMAVFSMSAAALGTLFFFTMTSFGAMANYATLDKQNREAVDKLTREIRQAKKVLSYATNSPNSSLSILNGSNQIVTYSFSDANKQMVRVVSGVGSELLLTNCTILNFRLYQRNPSNGNFGIFPVATTNWENSVKAVELTWKTRKTLNPTTRVNSENVQTARIVIRKQQD